MLFRLFLRTLLPHCHNSLLPYSLFFTTIIIILILGKKEEGKGNEVRMLFQLSENILLLRTLLPYSLLPTPYSLSLTDFQTQQT